MNTLKSYLLAATTAYAALFALPALAQDVSASGNVQVETSAGTQDAGLRAALQAKIAAHASTTAAMKAEHQETMSTNAKAMADTQIDNRIASLNALLLRIKGMKHVSDSYMTSATAAVQGEIGKLTDLKAKIDADADITVLKTDVKSIAPSLRIYMLVEPQLRIQTTAEKIKEIGTNMTTTLAKISARMSAIAASSTVDTSGVVAAIADANTKIADANVQATAAETAVASLSADNGDKTAESANHDALVKARADLKVAMTDLESARKEVMAALQTLRSIHVKAKVSATTTATTNVQ